MMGRDLVCRMLQMGIAFAVVLAVVPRAAVATTAALSPKQLVESREKLDGRVVAVRGEAIGESLRADAAHVWVNVTGGEVGVGAYMDRELAQRVRVFGDYNHRGDSVIVTGVFNLACDQHGGELDIHVRDLIVTRPGARMEHRPQPWKAGVGLVGFVVSGFAARALYYRRRGVAG